MGAFKEKALRAVAEDEIEIENTDTAAEEADEEIEPLMQEPFNPAEINIISKPDILRNIIERLNHDEIDMNTDFQRHAELWNNQKMSRLIESILIRFPLPAFYFASGVRPYQASVITCFIAKDKAYCGLRCNF